MITYSWTFPQFDVVPHEQAMTDVVKVIHWRLRGVDGSFSDEVYGTVTLPDPNPDDFVPFSQITQQWAIDQVSIQVDVEAMKALIATNLATQSDPPLRPVPPPFD